MIKRRCKICGKTFCSRNRIEVYCSEACREAQNVTRMSRRRMHEMAEKLRVKARLRERDEEYAAAYPKSVGRHRVSRIFVDYSINNYWR